MMLYSYQIKKMTGETPEVRCDKRKPREKKREKKGERRDRKDVQGQFL